MRKLQLRTDQPATLVSTAYGPEPHTITHEDQSRVQVLVVFLYEFLIILLRLLAVVFVESSPMVLVGRR